MLMKKKKKKRYLKLLIQYKTIYNKEINDIIIYEEITIENLGESIKKKNFKDILNEFSNFLKESNDENKKEYLVNELISFSIDNDKIDQMFKLRKESDNRYKNKMKEKNYNSTHIIWREVEDFWYDYHSKIIESKNNVNIYQRHCQGQILINHH